MQDRYIGIEISKTSNALRRNCLCGRSGESGDEATEKNAWIIGFLSDNEDTEIFQRDIEKQFNLRRSTVSQMLKLMEKKGLIRRESVSHDARLKRILMTDKARELHKKNLAELKDFEEKLKKDIPEKELEAFFFTLEKIRKNAEGKKEENL